MADYYFQSNESLKQLNPVKNNLFCRELCSNKKHIISMIDVIIFNSQCFIAIDSLGYMNLWIFREEFFSCEKEENKPDMNIIPSDLCFEIYHKDSNFRLKEFSQLDKINDYIVLSGGFDTIFIKFQQIQEFFKKLCGDSQSPKLKLPKIYRTKIEKLTSDFHLQDFSPFNFSTVNGFHIDSNKLLSYNNTGQLSIFDLQSMTLLNTMNLEDQIQLKCTDLPDSILTGKIVTKENKIIIGTYEGNLNIIDLNNFDHLGFFNLSSNKYFSSLLNYDNFSDVYVTEKESLTRLDITKSGGIVNIFLIEDCDRQKFLF